MDGPPKAPKGWAAILTGKMSSATLTPSEAAALAAEEAAREKEAKKQADALREAAEAEAAKAREEQEQRAEEERLRRRAEAEAAAATEPRPPPEAARRSRGCRCGDERAGADSRWQGRRRFVRGMGIGGQREDPRSCQGGVAHARFGEARRGVFPHGDGDSWSPAQRRKREELQELLGRELHRE